MNNLRLAARLVPQISTRCLSTTTTRMSVSMKQSYSDASGKGTVPAAEGYDRLRGLQVDMNADEHTWVWQKRGGRDTIPAKSTLALSAIAILFGCSIIYKMSFPPANQ